MATPNRVLAIAAATGRMAYVFFVGAELKDWDLSKKASKGPIEAAATAQSWINKVMADTVVTERVTDTLKGEQTIELIQTIQRTAAHNELLDVSVVRPRLLDSKYEEGSQLAKRYPEMAKRLPMFRKFYDSEPRDAVFIDALILAEEIIRPNDGAHG